MTVSDKPPTLRNGLPIPYNERNIAKGTHPDPARITLPNRSSMSISIKTPEEIEGMRLAGRLGAEVLDYITPFVKAGVTTGELDRLCHEYMTNVQGTIAGAAELCAAGLPALPEGGLHLAQRRDLPRHPGRQGAEERRRDEHRRHHHHKDGFHGDNSRMFFIGEPSILAKRLAEVTYECMWLGISKVKPGAYLGDIGHAIQQHAEKNGYSVVREFCGHGIGRVFHEEPQVLHYGTPGHAGKARSRA